MEKGILEANVDQLLNHLEALIEPKSQDLIGAREAAKWCNRQYDKLAAELTAAQGGYHEATRVQDKLQEADRRLLVVRLKHL
jgi:hypothetical protein